MTEASNTKTLEAKCFCGSVHFKVDVPVSSLPFLTHLCHCSLCRYASGAPCIFHAALPPDVMPEFVAPSSEKNMTAYLIGNGIATWNFCSTCGCHITCIAADKARWTVSTSIFIDGPEYFHIRKHIYSKSAKDGGIAQALTHTRGQDFIDWNPPDDRPDARLVESHPEVGEDGKERLRVRCMCKGVSFTIPRPTQEVIEDEFMSGFVSHKDESKWHAIFDACDDCRLVNGTHVVGWTFIPLSVCEPPIKEDLLIGTAKTFKSSDEVLRSFCGTCGATIFYSHSDRRAGTKQHMVDLATGILRAPEGAMAENWLTWRGRLAWFDSGKRYDEEFTESLQEGMNKLVLDRHGVVDDYSIG